MKKNAKEKKEKKETKKLTKKQIIILVIVTIVLGVICYFASTEITKSIIDHKTMNERLEKAREDSLMTVDTIENISLDDLVKKFNEISDDKLDVNDNTAVVNDMKIEFYLDDNNVNITTIDFEKRNKDAKDLISKMILANNDTITDETIDLIYDRVFETIGNTKDDESKTSEFFQYQGLEFSLKEYSDSDYRYSFRIGRIVEKQDENEENEEE